jgi:hypothetical protein
MRASREQRIFCEPVVHLSPSPPARPARWRGPWMWIGAGLGLTCGGSCAAGALLVLIGHFAGDTTAPRPSPPARPSPSPSPASRWGELRQVLARARAAVPGPSELAETRCPDGEILRAAGEHASTGGQGQTVLALPGVSYESLAGFVDRGTTRRADGDDDWLWLDSADLSRVRSEGSARRAAEETVGRRYLIVLRASTRSMPKVTGEGARLGVFSRQVEFRSGESFAPGVFQGGLAVVDVAAARVVCQVPLEVQSGDSFVYRRPVGRFSSLRDKPGDLLRSDFQDRFRKAARAALGRISKLLAGPW